MQGGGVQWVGKKGGNCNTFNKDKILKKIKKVGRGPFIEAGRATRKLLFILT